MRLGVATGFLLGAFFAVGGARAQSSTAQDGAPACTNEAPCVKSPAGDPSSHDLTPTQWLFGQNSFAKLAQPPMGVMDAVNRAGWKSAFEVADGSLKARTSDNKSPTGRVPSGAGATPTATAARPDSAAAMQRFLVLEWARTELGVADSVYHAHLQLLANTFDSAQRAALSDTARRRVMLRIDALLAGNNYTWLRFREDVVHRADSALAALAHVPPAR